MKRLVYKGGNPEDYPEDTDRMIRVAKERGFVLSRGDAACAWGAYSYDMRAIWMHLPENDDTLFQVMMRYLGEDDRG